MHKMFLCRCSEETNLGCNLEAEEAIGWAHQGCLARGAMWHSKRKGSATNGLNDDELNVFEARTIHGAQPFRRRGEA